MCLVFVEYRMLRGINDIFLSNLKSYSVLDLIYFQAESPSLYIEAFCLKAGI